MKAMGGWMLLLAAAFVVACGGAHQETGGRS